VTVNAKLVDIPSFAVRLNQTIEIREKSRKIVRISESLEAVDRRGVPPWLDLDKKAFKGTVKQNPSREDLTMPIQEQLIVELYSK
jgi:small subunit ribosomal protein S4